MSDILTELYATIIDRKQNPVHRHLHVRNQKWIGQILEFWAQIPLQIDACGQPPLADQVFQDRRKRTRRTGFLVLERFAARNPSERLGSHECPGP